MRRGTNPNLVINNFFSFATIVIMSITILIYNTFIVGEKENKIEKLPCEKEIFTYTKTYNQELLNKSIKAIEKGYYKVEGFYLKLESSKSSIEKVVSLDEMNKFYVDSVAIPSRKKLEKFLKIRYELVEGSKNILQNNKTERLKAGTLITSFRINSNDIFRVYTDLKFLYKNEIKKRVDCSIKVYKNHVQN
jgi:hypothetical protein